MEAKPNYRDVLGFNPDREYYYIETAHETWRGNDLSELMEFWVAHRSKWPALSVGRYCMPTPVTVVCDGTKCDHTSAHCETENDNFICTLARGHNGPHCACCFGADAHNLHIWA